MKTLLTIVGLLLLAGGLLFAAQGAGLIDWPSSSFMVGAPQWTRNGLLIAAVGLLLVILGWRRRQL